MSWGADSEHWHRELGRQAAAAGVDLLFGVGSGGAWVAAEASAAGVEASVADDAEAGEQSARSHPASRRRGLAEGFSCRRAGTNAAALA